MKKINLFIKTNSEHSKIINIETIIPYYKNKASTNYIFEKKLTPHLFRHTLKKNKAHLYKVIFLILSGIFSSLALYTHYSSLNWTCFLVLGDHTSAKNILCFISFFFAFCSFILGIYINPFREILNEVTRKKLKNAKKTMKKQLSELDSTNLNFREHKKQKKMIVQTYQDLKDSIFDSKNSSFLLLKNISISDDFSEKEREELSNQVIHEFENQLDLLIEDYKLSF